MNKPNPRTQSTKRPIKDWAALITIACLILIAISIVFGPISSKLKSVTPQNDQYSAKLERISNSYNTCIERADSGLPSPTSRVNDPMEGTFLSKENIAMNDREDCARTYNAQMRVLKNSQ